MSAVVTARSPALVGAAAGIWARIHAWDVSELAGVPDRAPADDDRIVDVVAHWQRPSAFDPSPVTIEDGVVHCWPDFFEDPLLTFDAAMRHVAWIACTARAGLLVHSAGLARAERAVVAVAPSDAGKSTLTELAADFVPLSDETVCLEWTTRPAVLGTQFRSASTRVPHLRRVSLAAILLLEKSNEPRFRPADKRTVSATMFAQAFRNPGITKDASLLGRIARFVNAVPAFVFSFPKDARANDLLRRLFDEQLSHPGA